MQIITCTCGVQIMILPDVARMGYAIDFHVSHGHKDSHMSEKGRIRDHLISQLLDAVGMKDCPWEVKRFDQL
jgi:hypothetical protein